MYKFHLEEMATALCDAGMLKEGVSVDEATDKIAECWKNKIAVSWNTDDVIHCGREMMEPPREIHEGDAEIILDLLLDDFDANDGINWDSIERGIEAYFPITEET